jgi:hypothetical protein
MSIKNKVVLAIALVVGSSSFALAQGFDPNLGNRIPQLNQPGVYGYHSGRSVPGLLPPSALESAPVGLYQHRYPVRPRYRTAPAGYGALRTAPVAMETSGMSVVQPDNYQYWRQACCF